MRYRELLVPLGIVSIVGSMLTPIPAGVLDYLLVANLMGACALLVSALCLTDPLKISSLPTMLLLAALWRLALNISTTRLILGSGSAGHVIEAFGALLIGNNIAVGVVIFLMITLIQLIVVAKGAERVAEVAARFTLDALPGKQMSIDADVRAGLIDGEAARSKREELQTESRFYGALDGAMKFVKGDAIAGILIVGINICGGFTIGMAIEGLSAIESMSKYTLLTVGDGLVSQIPALLNSLAAGVVVTKVVRGDGASLSGDLFGQIIQGSIVRWIVAVFLAVLALLPGMPLIPFVGGALVLLLSSVKRTSAQSDFAAPRIPFKPKIAAVLEVRVSGEGAETLIADHNTIRMIEDFRSRIYTETGLVVLPPPFSVGNDTQREVTVLLRGVPIRSTILRGPLSNDQSEISQLLLSVVSEQRVELIDDILTRRTLDSFDLEAPELVSSVVPSVATVTQISVILKSLARENISIKQIDLILQAISECGLRASNERVMIEEVRIALGRTICSSIVNSEGLLRVITIDPVIDLAFVQSEREGRSLELHGFECLVGEIETSGASADAIVASRSARSLIAALLRARGIKLPVLAIEEIPKDWELRSVGIAAFHDHEGHARSFERLAA